MGLSGSPSKRWEYNELQFTEFSALVSDDLRDLWHVSVEDEFQPRQRLAHDAMYILPWGGNFRNAVTKTTIAVRPGSFVGELTFGTSDGAMHMCATAEGLLEVQPQHHTKPLPALRVNNLEKLTRNQTKLDKLRGLISEACCYDPVALWICQHVSLFRPAVDEQSITADVLSMLKDVSVTIHAPVVPHEQLVQDAEPRAHSRASRTRLSRSRRDPAFFERGQPVFRQGDHADALYVVLDGAVRIVNESGRVYEERGPGSYFGELELPFSSSSAPARFTLGVETVAHTGASIARIPGDTIVKLMADSASFALSLFGRLARGVQAYRWLSAIGEGASAEYKVAQYLLYRSVIEGREWFPLDLQDLRNRLAVTPKYNATNYSQTKSIMRAGLLALCERHLISLTLSRRPLGTDRDKIRAALDQASRDKTPLEVAIRPGKERELWNMERGGLGRPNCE